MGVAMRIALGVIPLSTAAWAYQNTPETHQLAATPQADSNPSGEAPIKTGAVPSSGTCPSESETTSVGNHCVKLTGAKLDKFQTNTNQDFGSPTQWCVCLHLYAEQKANIASESGTVDCGSCASGAMSDAGLTAC